MVGSSILASDLLWYSLRFYYKQTVAFNCNVLYI